MKTLTIILTLAFFAGLIAATVAAIRNRLETSHRLWAGTTVLFAAAVLVGIITNI